jgi:hypothetical protein
VLNEKFRSSFNHLEITFATPVYPVHRVNTPFILSLTGKLIIIVVTVILRGGCLILELALNIVTTILFKKYLAKRQKLLNMIPLTPSPFSYSRNILKSSPPQAETKAEEFNSEKRATFTCLVLSLISIIHQIILIVFNGVQTYIGISETTGILIFVSNYSNNFRHVLGFFVFLFFDKNFKNDINVLYKKLKDRFIIHLE